MENHLIYKLDTRSSSEVTVDKFSLKFRLPQVVLSMRGNYSITMDRGVVVGLGCTSDGPPSPGFSSLKDWPFDVGVCSKGTYMGQNNQCRGKNIAFCVEYHRGTLCSYLFAILSNRIHL